jgi:predicted ribosome quality control (RQC) complex YloA/Tae2 family protein
MILSALHIAAWVNEIRNTLIGATVTRSIKDELRKTIRITVDDDRDIVFTFMPGTSLLFLEKMPARRTTRIRTTNFLPQIVGLEIAAVDQINFDRIVRIELHRGRESYSLIFELFGNAANLQLLDPEERIITSLRSPQPGIMYSPVEPPEGVRVDFITAEDLNMWSDGKTSQSIRDVLEKNTRGADQSFWKVALGQDEESPVDSLLKETSTQGLISRIRFALERCLNGATPAVSDDRTIRWSDSVTDNSAKSSINDSIATIALNISKRYAMQSMRQRVSQSLKARKKRLDNKLSKLHTQVHQTPDAYTLKKQADLLTINMPSLRKGMTSIAVLDVFDPDQPEIVILLHAELSPSANVERLFKRHRKLIDGMTSARKQIEETKRQLNEISHYAERMEQAQSVGDLADLERELVKQGFLNPPKSRYESRRKEEPVSFHPREYSTPAGEKILVGRNSRENDFVTFVASKKYDYWFHSQQTTGSHVILRLPDKNTEPSYESIKYAASLAAYFSQARHSEKVPVIYTQTRYLQRIKGSPGKVKYTQVRSLMVEPLAPDSS